MATVFPKTSITNKATCQFGNLARIQNADATNVVGPLINSQLTITGTNSQDTETLGINRRQVLTAGSFSWQLLTGGREAVLKSREGL